MINIQDITPFMKKGWVAMDDDGLWRWYEDKPIALCGAWLRPSMNCKVCKLESFDIDPADDWSKSLIKVG